MNFRFVIGHLQTIKGNVGKSLNYRKYRDTRSPAKGKRQQTGIELK